MSVYRSWEKTARPGIRVIVRLSPPQKVVRVVGKGAHVPGPHIQQQGTAVRPIGQAPSHGCGFFHHHYRKRWTGVPEKLCGENGAAEASADDGDGDPGRSLARPSFAMALAHHDILLAYVYNVYYISRHKAPHGAVAKRQGKGLQNPHRRFDSAPRLQLTLR